LPTAGVVTALLDPGRKTDGEIFPAIFTLSSCELPKSLSFIYSSLIV